MSVFSPFAKSIDQLIIAQYDSSGYIERAQGIIQGQVEFLFNIPSSLTLEPWEIQIGSLEEYWDSELPRFGEKDAKGWTHYVTEEDEVAMENQMDQTKLPSQDAVDDALLKAFADNNVERYQYSRWAAQEKELNTACWFPIRTTGNNSVTGPGMHVVHGTVPDISHLYSV